MNNESTTTEQLLPRSVPPPDAAAAEIAPGEPMSPPSSAVAQATVRRLEGLVSGVPHTLELLLDVRINVSVEVGRVEMPVRQVMELSPGAVIELERSATEPVEIYANGRCIGRGEVVVVGEQFGVRVTELGASTV